MIVRGAWIGQPLNLQQELIMYTHVMPIHSGPGVILYDYQNTQGQN